MFSQWIYVGIIVIAYVIAVGISYGILKQSIVDIRENMKSREINESELKKDIADIRAKIGGIEGKIDVMLKLIKLNGVKRNGG